MRRPAGLTGSRLKAAQPKGKRLIYVNSATRSIVEYVACLYHCKKSGIQEFFEY
jgi:hypothetical protein